MNHPRAKKHVFQFQGQDEFYWAIGNPNHPALLLLPGLTASHTGLLEFSYKLRGDYFLLIPDLPGWGDSPRFRKRLTLVHYAQYLGQLLKHLRIEKLSIFGHCMGAALAIEYASQYPKSVERLILVSPPFEEGKLSYKLLLHLTDAANRSPRFLHRLLYFWHNYYMIVFTSFFVVRFRSLRKKLRWIVKTEPTQPETPLNYEEIWTSLMHYNFRKIQHVQLPIHLIYGAHDLLIGQAQAEKFHQLIPTASIDFIEQAGHLAPVETPDTLATLTLQYLTHPLV